MKKAARGRSPWDGRKEPWSVFQQLRLYREKVRVSPIPISALVLFLALTRQCASLLGSSDGSSFQSSVIGPFYSSEKITQKGK